MTKFKIESEGLIVGFEEHIYMPLLNLIFIYHRHSEGFDHRDMKLGKFDQVERY